MLSIKQGIRNIKEDYVDGSHWVLKSLGALAMVYVLVAIALSFYWNREPNALPAASNQAVTGAATTTALLNVATSLLDKPGGYLSNDVSLPGVWMDNIPNWEYGVLIQVRDLSRALRKDFSRSQSQSTEDADLAVAEPQFNFDSQSWMLPSSEGEYRTGIDALGRYLGRLSDQQQSQAQFYARADNLTRWLGDVETRLGSLSQRLSASVGQKRLNTDLAGDASATQSTSADVELEIKTPWSQIDDVFYEARGASWALIQLLHAIEVDFSSVLEKKNALVSLRQIIRELEATQETLWSPMILNGSGFGLLANHSLVMASYISRANAGIIDLRELLTQG
ncbi:MAG: DUF2333 family protein [Oceanospirillaceae bacterium]|nr:DUF2333 family protein [Oceanospirillaceae bacterium]